MPRPLSVAVFGRLTRTTRGPALQAFLQRCRHQEVKLSILASYSAELREAGLVHEMDLELPQFDQLEQLAGTDVLCSIGGDGTILDAVRFLGRSGIPILGVNAGRLGFLASVSQDELVTALDELLLGRWRLDRRTLVTVDTLPNDVFPPGTAGLNEVTIHKSNSNEMITVHTYLNGQYLNSYWTDGLIVATPTGSTAYNLACGGPIMSPHSQVLVINPIAPHSLTVRPMVLPDDAVLSFSVESRSGQALVAVDNITRLITDRTELAVRKADYTVPLVRLTQNNYYDTLRKRLNWGLDYRNET